uniref:polycystin-1-like protein 1 n=1 Tax=Panthera onca TaxID=9690 RepID=UPI00295352C2|nr:polycystin-1-like protein 1 [Panthera onca]
MVEKPQKQLSIHVKPTVCFINLCKKSRCRWLSGHWMAILGAHPRLSHPVRCVQTACCWSSRGTQPPRARAEEHGGPHPPCLHGAPVDVRANPAPFMNTDESSRPLGARTRAEGDPGLEKPPSLVSLVSWDKNILETTGEAPLSVFSGRTGAASDPGDSANRNNREPSVTISSSWSSRGPRPCRRRMCVVGKVSSAFCGLPQCTRPVVGSCSVTVGIPSCTTGRQRSAEDVAPDLLPGTDVTSAAVTMGAPVGARASAQTSAPISHSPTLPRSSLGHDGSVSWPRPKQLCPLAQCLPEAISVQGPADAVDPTVRCFPEADTPALLSLGFRVQVASDASLCLLLDFGDSCGVQVRIHDVSEGTAVTAFHQFGKEGVYMLKAVIHSEFRGTEKELGPYYVDIGPATVSVSMNSSSIHKDGLLVLTDSLTDQKGTVVTHRFPTGPSWNVSFTSRTPAGGGQAWKPVTVRFQMQPVSVYTNGTVFATDTDITFLAVTKETVPLEFLWYFGEGPPVRTTSRSIRKRLRIPQWYSVTVQASSRLGRVASEPHRIRAQRRIVANRLASPSSALLNTSVTFECRLNFGSDVAFLWDFGDGAVGLGGSSASHSYSREGEFTVQVLAFNDVSTASLRKQLFIVREPCQPPPVKNMGPGKVQVWRSQPVNLGVTFESAILCDISQGLSYTWTFWNSEGARVPLPPAVSTHGQTLTVPGYFLQPGNYTALAKVQVEGSVVHSSYRVGVEVRARAPVSVISEGTHLFISRAPSSIIVLRGSQSYDPDSPGAVLRYHWKCTAASAPGHPCFSASSPHSLDAGAPTLSFPADSLSNSYDQFLVTLMVSSGGRNSSEAQVFLSPRPDSALRCVLSCAPCTADPRGAPFRALPYGCGSHCMQEPGPQEKGADQGGLGESAGHMDRGSQLGATARPGVGGSPGASVAAGAAQRGLLMRVPLPCSPLVPTSGSGRLAVLQWPRAPPPWSGFAAWATCWMVSVACGLGTAFLGYRFNPTQCAQWLHLLTLSVLCCVFVTQPLLVGLVALGFAWRKRDDPHFFTESLREATKDLGSELEGHVRSPTALRASQMEEMVAARQRARRLRWARPPSAAQLSVTRERMRRETRTRVALRDVCMYTLMLLLHWFVLCGKVSQDEYALNQAIRNEFTRNARSSSGGLTSVGAWWDWSLTTLLDGLHGRGAHTASVPRAQPGALGGKCYLMGALVIKQLRASSDSECELPSPPSVLTEDSPPTRSPQVGATDTSSVTDPAVQGVAASGPGDYGAREHWVLSLGSTRAAAHAALSGLRASRWIDRSTRAVSVHFTLYNPPTRLLSSVSLRAELLPAGGLALSPLVESVAVFHSDSSRWYRLTLPELVFLALNLIGLCLHLSGVAETGVRSYWHSPGRWLELTMAGAGLAYHAASSHLVTLTGEVTDHFQKGFFHEFLDLSLVTSWNQRVSWLQGTLSFVLTLKCICLIGVQTPVASCSFLTRRSFAGVFAAGLAGVLMLAAHSHLRAALPGTFTDVSRGLPFRFPGRRQRDTFPGLSKSDPRAPAWCCGAFFIVTSTVWLGTLRGSLMTLVRKRKSFQSKSLVRLEDVTACVWGQCLALLGLERPQREEAETVESQHYYLDEVSDLLEELLLKINGLSDSLRLPLPEQQSCDETEARAEGGPLGSISA